MSSSLHLKVRTAFSLVEMAMVLAISGLMLGFVLQANQSTAPAAECYNSTKVQLITIRAAIENFARKNDRLPMPAKRALGVEDINYGRETIAANLTVTGTSTWGALPFQALGLSPSFAADCWGNKFTYVVTTALTTSNPVGGYLDTTVDGALTLNSSTANTINTNTAYAVISHGEDALGAVKANATAAAWCSTGAPMPLKYTNCNAASATVADAVFNDGKDAAANYFDDIIVAAGRPQMLNSTNLFCWGSNLNGTGILADSDTSVHNYTSPHASTTNLSFAKLTDTDSGYTSSPCALTGDGTAYCWGANNYGQIGDGTTTTRSLPTAVSGATKYRDIFTMGQNGATHCGIARDYTLWCWGYNNISMLPGVSGGTTPTPTQVDPSIQFTKILSSGANGLCGLSKTGDVYCRGSAYQNYGDGPAGTATTQANMTIVPGGHKFAELEGINPICGITSAADAGGAGKLYCWGYLVKGAADMGALGLTPAAVTGITLGATTTITYTPGTYNFSSVDGFYLQSVQGPTALNFRTFYARPGHYTANTVELSSTWTTFTAVDTSNAALYPAYISGGAMAPTARNVPTLVDGTGGITFTKMVTNRSALSTTGQLYSWGSGYFYDIGDGSSAFPFVTHASFTAASPAVFTTAAAHGYATGDFLYFNLNATLTAQGGRSGGITLNAGDASADGAYVGKSIIITSGTGTAGVRVGNGYTSATKVLDISQKWATVPDATSQYLIGTPITSQGGTTSTITMNAAASGVNNFYVGQTIGLVGGTGSGGRGVVTAYDGTTKVATMSGLWTAPTVNTTYLVGTPVNAQAADNTSYVILSAGASAVNNFYTGQTIRILSSSYTITAYDGTTKRATISPTISTAPVAGSAYYIGANLDAQMFKVGAVTATTFELYNLDGTPVDTTYGQQGYAGTSYKIPIDGTCFAPTAALAKCAYTPTAMPQTLAGVPYTISDAYKAVRPYVAIGSNGIYGWGLGGTNVGMGDNTTTLRTSPVKVDTSNLLGGESLIGPIYHGSYEVCMPTNLGNTYCWSPGAPTYYNQLGDGTTSVRLKPTLVAGGKKFRSMSFPTSLSGTYNTAACALEDKAALNCAAQTVNWSAGPDCTATSTAMSNGDEQTVTDSVGPKTGTATATCVGGVIVASNKLCM